MNPEETLPRAKKEIVEKKTIGTTVEEKYKNKKKIVKEKIKEINNERVLNEINRAVVRTQKNNNRYID